MEFTNTCLGRDKQRCCQVTSDSAGVHGVSKVSAALSESIPRGVTSAAAIGVHTSPPPVLLLGSRSSKLRAGPVSPYAIGNPESMSRLILFYSGNHRRPFVG